MNLTKKRKNEILHQSLNGLPVHAITSLIMWEYTSPPKMSYLNLRVYIKEKIEKVLREALIKGVKIKYNKKGFIEKVELK